MTPSVPRRPMRLLIGLTATSLVIAGVGAVPATAASMPAAKSNSAWLASKLQNGRYESPLSGRTDYGLMIDALYAMRASGDLAKAQPILRVLDNQKQAIKYFSYSDFLGNAGRKDRIGGAVAKTALAAIVSGRNPRDFGGYNMIAEVKRTISKDPKTLGKVRDYGPNTGSDEANTFGQTLAVLALAGVRQNDRSAIRALLMQQCSEGYFRIFYARDMDGRLRTCDQGKADGLASPDGDSTGFALSALLAARQAGAKGLNDDIDDAIGWLVANHQPGGGWGGGVGTEAPNTNSTGLIVQALADSGAARGTVRDGERYIKRVQATKSRDAGTQLSSDIGAIAYNRSDYETAQNGGITSLDTWIRASAQASLGLSQVGFGTMSKLPNKRLHVNAPNRKLTPGTTIRVRVGGLAPGEMFTLTARGVRLAEGNAGTLGKKTVKVRVLNKWKNKRVSLRIVGSQHKRWGTDTIHVAKPKRSAH